MSLSKNTVRKHFPKLDSKTRQAICDATKVGSHFSVAASTSMEKINKLLDYHGVESYRGEGHWNNIWWMDTIAYYCNSGDTYTPTIWYLPPVNSWDTGRWVIADAEQIQSTICRRYKIKPDDIRTR